jgi:hypothetical protein
MEGECEVEGGNCSLAGASGSGDVRLRDGPGFRQRRSGGSANTFVDWNKKDIVGKKVEGGRKELLGVLRKVQKLWNRL